MSEFDEFKATYFDECSELLLDLEEQFASIQGGDQTPDRLNAVFRAIHSIKGGAGAFGFSSLVSFAHAFETLLDGVRSGRIPMTPPLVALCLRSNDIVADFVNAAREGVDLPLTYGMDEKARFDAVCAGKDAFSEKVEEIVPEEKAIEDFDIDFTPVAVVLKTPSSAGMDDRFDESPFVGSPDTWQINFKPHTALYARAGDPLLLFRELSTLGETTILATLADVPSLADFDPCGVYCSWVITLASATVGESAIREVFEFVDGDCDLSIAQVGEELAAAAAIDFGLDDLLDAVLLESSYPGAAKAPASDKPVPSTTTAKQSPDTLFDTGFAELAEAFGMPKPPAPATAAEPERRPQPPTAQRKPEALAAEHVEAPAKGGATAEADGERKGAGLQSIRVDLDKVDRVVNMVGELVITQSMLTQQMDESLRARYQELVRGLEVLAQTTRGLQDAVMAIRAQPVKSVFSRMPRLVRELAGKTGKQIRLETVGEATEIDKTVIEQLSDPLTHMIRNSADHGIEMPARRLAGGKSETGVIRLSAEQAGGSILIVVEDDGAGINRERVLHVARERGVVPPDQQLSDEQIDQLIFAPGFSTADAVSDISGRGVGMDVVLSNIKKIGGSVHVRSVTGRGTRMTLRLPLTLAVLDVMLVKVGQTPYVIPLSSIVETIQCSRAEFGRIPSGAKVLQLTHEYVEVIDLAERFSMRAGASAAGRFVVLCEAEGSSKVALIVDDIIGQQQVVIKSLEENYQRIEGIAGGTILGDGNVALIVDVQGLKSTPGLRSAA